MSVPPGSWAVRGCPLRLCAVKVSLGTDVRLSRGRSILSQERCAELLFARFSEGYDHPVNIGKAATLRAATGGAETPSLITHQAAPGAAIISR